MDIALFFYNLILTILYAFCAVGFLILYFDRDDMKLIMISAIFAVFVADNLLLYMNEFLPQFHGYYSNTLNTAPVLPNMAMFLIVYLYRRTFIYYDGSDISTKERGVWILLFIGVCIATFNYTSLAGKIASIALLNGPLIFIIVQPLVKILRKGPYPASETAPPMPLWFVVTFLILEIAATVEFSLNVIGFTIIHGRTLSIELVGLLLSVCAVTYLTDNFSKLNTAGNAEALEDSEKDDYKLLEEFAIAYKLTNREQNILEHLIEGESIAQICDAECIAVGTVKSHTHNIYQKLEVSNRVQLITLLNEFKLNNK